MSNDFKPLDPIITQLSAGLTGLKEARKALKSFPSGKFRPLADDTLREAVAQITEATHQLADFATLTLELSVIQGE